MESEKPILNDIVTLLDNPPLNHNPLIGLLHIDTLINVHEALAAIQELILLSHEKSSNQPQGVGSGAHYLMCCIKDALMFEIEYRSKIQHEAK